MKKVAASGGVGTSMTAVMSQHPLVLAMGDSGGGVTVRDQRANGDLIVVEDLPEDDDTEARLFKILDEHNAAEERIAERTEGDSEQFIQSMYLGALKERPVGGILPTQVANLLVGAKIKNMGELQTWPKARLMTINGIKEGRAELIDQIMADIGLPLATS